MSIFRIKSVQKRFVLGLAIVITVTLLISSAAFIFYNARSTEKDLQRQMDRFLTLSIQSLPIALWEYTDEYVNDYIDSLFLYKDVVFARVVAEKRIVKTRTRDGYQNFDFSIAVDPARFIAKKSDIMYNNVNVGKITIVMSKERVRRQIIYNSLTAISLLLLVIATISITIYYLFRSYIFNPLIKLENSARLIGGGDLDVRIDITSEDEIGQLAQTFNQMVQNIKAITASRDELDNEVTERKQAEEALRESEDLLKATLESTTDGILVVNEMGQVTHTNNRYAKMWRIPNDLIEVKDDEKLLSYVLGQLTDPKTFLSKVQGLYKTSKEDFDTISFKDGRVFERFSRPLIIDGEIDGRVWSFRDVTEKRRAEEELRKHAETQQVLLREVNHRVKNNLSAIIGMLYKEQDQAEKYGRTSYLDMLGDLVGRLQGLSTVHSLLSASGWRPLLLTELCEQVINSVLQVIPLDKKFSLDVKASPLRVSSDQAHHLTLVINELATNTIKHALKGRDDVQVDVDFIRDGEMVQIVFRDNGPGYPQDMIEKNFSRASIGFDLILGIVTESLRGNVQLGNDNGAVTTVTFKNKDVDE